VRYIRKLLKTNQTSLVQAESYTRFLLPSDESLSFSGSLFEQGIPQGTEEEFFYHLPEWIRCPIPQFTPKKKKLSYTFPCLPSLTVSLTLNNLWTILTLLQHPRTSFTWQVLKAFYIWFKHIAFLSTYIFIEAWSDPNWSSPYLTTHFLNLTSSWFIMHQ